MSDGKSRVRKPLKSRVSAQQRARANGASEETPTANALPPAEAQIGERGSERGAEEPRIVCLGASAGGLEALEQFFRGIPPNTGAAFIAILHLAGDFKNVMTELLARYTTMRIKSVTATTPLEPNVVYVMPPSKNLLYAGGRIVVQEQDRLAGRGANFPIDLFLESLASGTVSDAIALILSGTGADGSRGIRALKAAGGSVLIQDPESAKFDSMPRSALQTDVHDGTGAADRLAEKVVALLRHPASEPVLEPAGGEGAAISAVLDAVRGHCGVDLSYMRPQMLRRRIERRMMFLAIRDLEEYASRLSTDGDEARALRKDLLIGVTGFFRDPEVYDTLRRHLLRYLSGMRNGDQFRAWLPACATGEEAYSIAMLLAEGMEAAGVRLDVKIFATDIDEEALVQAARAQYPVSNSKDMTAAQLARYFYNDGNVLTVRPVLREMLIFARHNLVRDPPFARLDLVSCRNFLIYATNEFQTEVLRSLHFGLKQGGLLLLGSSETLGSLEREYQPVAAGQRLFSKLSRAVLRSGRRTGDIVGGGAWRGRAVRAEAERDDGLRQVVELLAAERGSTVVTTNDEGVLLEVIADELGVFRLPKGKPSNDLLRLANFELAGALRMVWHRAKTGEDTLNYLADFPASTGGRAALSARRLAATGPLPERILITIEPVAPAGIEAGPESSGFGDAAQRIGHLERELRNASENLQSTIEELDTMSEEQQITLQDLQAAAEELQSTSEELVTVNAEQQKRLQEVAVLNADLKNLLHSVNVGTLFLDAKLRIRRFTSGVDEIIKLMDRDVGRPIESVSHQFGADFITALQEVLCTGETHERQLRSAQGKWLLVRALPYRGSAGDETSGIVVTTTDVTAITNAQQLTKLSSSQFTEVNKELARRGEELEDLFSIVAHDLKRPVIALDGLLQLASDDLGLSVDDAHVLLAQAKTECTRMKRMLEDLAELSSASRREIALQDIDLQPWLDSVLHRFTDLAEQRNVRLSATCDPAQLTVPQSALEEAVENLVENAFKYGCTDPRPRIDVSCRVTEGVLELNVIDNGKGIPPESHEKVFEPFRRLEPDVADGSGMGLVAVRRALGGHGGVVTIDPQVERGTKFVVRVPLGGATLDVRAVSGKRRVLVVEDDALDYTMIVRMLGEDFEVTRAHQLTDAELRLSEDPFHMVLLDLSLPDGHGLELIKRMRSLLERPVPVVVVTGHGEGITSDSLAAGLVSGWVSKAQLTKETLQATIERALAA